MKGKIVKLISNDYTVKTLDEEFVCKARGKFRNMGLSPIVGDEVIFDENNKYILEVLPRKNELNRPTVANVDIAVIIYSISFWLYVNIIKLNQLLFLPKLIY